MYRASAVLTFNSLPQQLTLEQVKERLRVEKWLFGLAAAVGMLVCLAATLAAVVHGG